MKRILWLGLFVLASCTSLSKKAQEYFEAGAYDEAVQTYDTLLQKEPDNADAIAGRAKAREKLVDTRLIQIRQARLAGNQQNALDMLLKIVEQENAWGFSPKGGAVAYTQDEESREALKYVDAQVRAALPTHYPLRAEYLLGHYGKIFQGDLLAHADGLRAMTHVERESVCRRFVSSAPSPGPYYLEFLEKFCTGSAALPKRATHSAPRKFSELYRGVKVTAKIDGFPEGFITILKDQLRQGLTRTPWFDARGTGELAVTLNGHFTVEQHDQPEARWHQYTVSVPYTAYEDQPRTREVPYSTTEYQCAPGTTNCSTVPVTRFRTENYSESVPVTRYRDDPRTQPYTGRQRFQTLTVFLNAHTLFGTAGRDFGINEKSQDSGFEHDFNMPEIGLRPQSANLPDPQAWLKQQAAKLVQFTEENGDAAWEQLYCRPLADGLSIAETGEQVHRCLRRQPPVMPKFVESWYERNVGLSMAQAEELLGTKDF